MPGGGRAERARAEDSCGVVGSVVGWAIRYGEAKLQEEQFSILRMDSAEFVGGPWFAVAGVSSQRGTDIAVAEGCFSRCWVSSSSRLDLEFEGWRCCNCTGGGHQCRMGVVMFVDGNGVTLPIAARS